MDESPPDDILSWNNFIYVADFIERSGHREISFLGGEPFLHPKIVDFVLYLIERDFHVNIFTSGIMNEIMFNESQQYLSGLPFEKFSIVCNLNDPKSLSFSESEAVKRFLSVFGHLVTPGFNIYKLGFDLNFLVNYINQYGMKRHIRLGLAHPIPGTKNASIPKENLPEMAKNLMRFLPVIDKFNISPGFDCGFPMCLFSNEDIGLLYKITKGNLRFGCGPAIDIGPDMKVWSCFPLSNYQKKSVYDFDTYSELYDFYMDLHRKIRIESSGLYLKCDNCIDRNRELCSGGCLSHNLHEFVNEPKLRLEEVYPDE